MDVLRYGVHAAHCCARCGCKYGDEDCPVVSGEIEAKYDCSECDDEFDQIVNTLKHLSPEELHNIMRRVYEE